MQKNNRGITLIEVIMMIIIIGIAFPMIFKGLINSRVKQIDSHRALDFAYLFQEKMEKVVPLGYDSVYTLTLAAVNPENPVSGYSAYRRDVYISYVNPDFTASGAETVYRKVIVSVRHIPSGVSFSGSTILRRRT